MCKLLYCEIKSFKRETKWLKFAITNLWEYSRHIPLCAAVNGGLLPHSTLTNEKDTGN